MFPQTYLGLMAIDRNEDKLKVGSIITSTAAIGMSGVVAGLALLKSKKWAWWATLIIPLLAVLWYLSAFAVSLQLLVLIIAVIMVIVYLVILYYAHRTKAKDYFGLQK